MYIRSCRSQSAAMSGLWVTLQLMLIRSNGTTTLQANTVTHDLRPELVKPDEVSARTSLKPHNPTPERCLKIV